MMNRLYIIITLLVCFLAPKESKAQDIHYTLFDMSPLALNPAMAGGFSGSVRISGIVRDQWFSGLDTDGDLYLTPTINIDAPIIKGLRKQDWIGVGVGYLFNDNAGNLIDDKQKKGTIVSSGFYAGAAYHLALDEDQNNVLTFGAQYGNLTKTLRQVDFLYENNYLGSGTNSGPTGEVTAEYKTDINVGATLSGKTGDSTYYRIGASMYHINSPKAKFDNGPDEKLGPRMSIHGTYEYPLSDDLIITPRALFQNYQSTSMIVVQGLASYKFNPTTWLHGGLGYRFGDAIQVLAGVNLKKLRIMASYDLTVSQLANASSFELSASYIFNIYKKPKLTPVIFCPRF